MSNVKDLKYKPTKLVLNGKEHTLQYDLNAFAELEDKFGSVEAAMKAMEKGSIKVLRTFIWAGLVHEDETITERYVGSVIMPGELESISEKIAEAIENSAPTADTNPNK